MYFSTINNDIPMILDEIEARISFLGELTSINSPISLWSFDNNGTLYWTNSTSLTYNLRFFNFRTKSSFYLWFLAFHLNRKLFDDILYIFYRYLEWQEIVIDSKYAYENATWIVSYNGSLSPWRSNCVSDSVSHSRNYPGFVHPLYSFKDQGNQTFMGRGCRESAT